MEMWKKYITAGNKKFVSCDFESARLLYEQARAEAESLFIRWREPNEAVAAVVVSYHNLADLYQKQGYSNMARLTLEAAHQLILEAVTSTPIESDRHPALYRGSIVTYSALLAHKRCYFLAKAPLKHGEVTTNHLH